MIGQDSRLAGDRTDTGRTARSGTSDFDRFYAIEPIRAEAIDEPVQERGQVLVVDRRAPRHGVELRELQWLGGRGDEVHGVDAGARIDLLEPFVQEPCEMRRIARWLRRADTDRLHRIVHALEQQVELACAERHALQPTADKPHQLFQHRCESLGRADRLDEHQAPLDDIRWRQRMDALELFAERLGEPQGDHSTEPLYQWRTGGCSEIADVIEAKAPQAVDHVRRQPQRLNGQGLQSRSQSVCGHDGSILPAVSRHRVGGAWSLGDGHPSRETGALEAGHQVRQQRILAAGEMGAPVRIEPDTIGGIGGDQWCIAQAPCRELRQRRFIGLRLGLAHAETGYQRLRARERYAARYASGLCLGVGCCDNPAPSVMR